MIAIPIQADAGPANAATAAALPANAGSQGASGFAQALLSATGSESQPTAKTGKLSVDPGLGNPTPEEGQKNAEAILALNLAAPVMTPPVIDVGNVLGPVMAAPTVESTTVPAEKASEGTSVQPLVSEERGDSAGGATKQVVPLPSDSNLAPADTPPVPATTPDFGNLESSATAEVPLPPLTASTEQPPACTRPAATGASAEPAGVCGFDEATPPSACITAEESADPPSPAETVSSSVPSMESKGGAELAPRPAATNDMPAQVKIETQSQSPAPEPGGTARPADAPMTEPAPMNPELQKLGEPILGTLSVGRVSAGAASTGHPARELRLPISMHRVTVIPMPGQAAEKPKAAGGGTEIHGPRASSSQSQAETTPADTAGKMPQDSAGRQAAMAPLTAVPNPHSGEAASSQDSGIVSVPASPPSNQSLADPGTPSPAMKAQTPLPADSAPNPLPSAGGVNAARIVDRMGQSEMHIGLRTLAFGSVEVHTVVRDSQVGLAVGSERGDLRTFLSAEVPGLQTTFQQHDLHFDNIRFLDHGPGFDMAFSAGADSQSRSFQQGGRPAPGWPGFGVSPTDSSEVELAGDARTGLNVHA